MSATTTAQLGLGGDLDRRADASSKLAARFVIPPFTVLDAKQGYWQSRKNAWIDLGIKSEIGRGDNGSAKAFGMGLSANPENKWAKEDTKGSGTSIFDPVICELIYRWFTAQGDTILDPFAGGSVRGIVAGWLGRSYVGIDLSEQQIEANRTQASMIVPLHQPVPMWVHGDSYEILEPPREEEFDFVFSCPPYADLEVYSKDPRDLSNMPYERFRDLYRGIIARSVACLRPDRFAAFVVGDIRDKKRGVYRNFVGDTIQAFIDAGADYYNEGILLTSVGTLPVRTAKQFEASRKFGKAHQNVLVFVKGDPKRATEHAGIVDVGTRV